MPNGKTGDNPLSDLTIHGHHPFPSEIEVLLLEINRIGRASNRWPLGENWPFSPIEFDWERGERIDEGIRLLTDLLARMREGRGDEFLVSPRTGKPFIDPE
jgi:hypothetical protein